MAKTFSKLTRPTMRKLAAGDKLNEHGITFERQANGDGVFTVNFMVDGQRIHRVIGRESDGTTRTQAEEFIDKARQDAKAGRLNLPKGRKLALSFREAADKYLTKLEQEGGKDMPHEALPPGSAPCSVLRRRAAIEDRHLRRGTLQKAAWHRELVMRPNGPGGKPVYGGETKPATINRELAALSHLLNKAVEWGWLDHKPATIKRLKEHSGRITYLTVEQIERLLKEAAGRPEAARFTRSSASGSIPRCARPKSSASGVSISTCKSLVIYIPKAKAGAREQPITRSLAEYLTSYVASSSPAYAWLFPSIAAKEGRTVNLDKPFRRCVLAAGLDVKQVVRHTLRHTAITHLVQAGVDLPTVKRISGHKNLSMVERYSHQNGAHIQTAMDKLSERYKKVN
jgi:integrase